MTFQNLIIAKNKVNFVYCAFYSNVYFVPQKPFHFVSSKFSLFHNFQNMLQSFLEMDYLG